MNQNLILNTRLFTSAGLFLSRIPPHPGYTLARWIGLYLAGRKSNPAVRAVRANQWVVHGERGSSRELDGWVRENYASTARSLYEFWHFHPDDEAVRRMVTVDPSFTVAVEGAYQAGSGLILVVPHLSNFDLIGRAVVLKGTPLHVLSYPQPGGGYQAINALREIPDLKVTPLAVESLRQASETLRAGGTVLTGVDRPLAGAGAEAKYAVRFFGRPACLPVFHIRLALKHNLPITVVGGRRNADGGYTVWASEPIPLVRRADLTEEIVENAEAVLAVLAEVIRQVPQEWAMSYPVWPEALDQIPGL